ncbi:histidine kinase [Dactylosporangium cerinum]
MTASRARIVAAADDARRRFERDLHDGAQQRLVSLCLELRMAEASLPAELDTVKEPLSQTAKGLTGVFDDLREIARGIHPAILSKEGSARRSRRSPAAAGSRSNSTWTSASSCRSVSRWPRTTSCPRCSPTPPSTPARLWCVSTSKWRARSCGS